MNNSNKDAVYNALASLGATDLGTREEFYAKLDIPANREKVYNALQMRGATDLGTFGEFDSKLGYTPRFSTEFSTEEIITPDSPFAPFKGMEKEETNLEGMMTKIGGGIESTKQNLGTLDKIGQSTLGRMPLENLPTSLADIHSLTTDYASYRNLLMDNIKQGKVGREEYEFLETERAKGTKMVDEMLARAKEVRDSMAPSEYSTEVAVNRGGATAHVRTTEGGKIDHLIESLEKLKRDYENYTTKADKELGGRGSGFGRGLDEFSLLDTVTAGWSDVLSGIDTALVLEKASSGQPLTKVEQLYLPMIEEKARLGEIVKAEGGLTTGYIIGASTAQMPSFIAGMMTTSPIGKGIEKAVKGVAKEAVEEVAKKTFKDFMVKAGKSVLSSGAYAAAATPLQSMMYDNYVDNTINEYLEFGGVNSSTAERLVKGYRQALPEIFFESLGGIMSGTAKYVLPKSGIKARMATKLAKKWGIHEGVMKDITERAAISGFLEETEEEMLTNLLSPYVEGLSKEERQQRYGEAFSKEGIWTTIATTALVSGGFGIARGIESGIQVRNYSHLEQKALDALGNIKDANLRQMVFDAGEKGSLVETARAMAKIDWSAYDDGDVGNAIDYFRNNISRQVYAGVEVADQAEKALDGMAASIVGVQYGNSGKVITASVADSPVILLGVDTKTQTAMVRYEDGRREQVPLNEVKDQVTMPVDDLVAQLWGKEIEKVEAEVVPAQEAERKAKVEAMGITTSTPQARTYNVGDMVNVNGEEGEIISISPASRTARVNTPSGEAIEVSLDEITPIEGETSIVEEEVVETTTPTTQEAQPQAKVEVPAKVEPVRNEKGEVDFSAMDVEQSAAFIEEDMGEEQGLTFADARIAEQKAQLKKVESAKDVPTDYDAAKKVLSERKAMAEVIKTEIAKWEAIKERVSAITAEKAQAEQTTPQVEEVAPVETTEQTEVVAEQAQAEQTPEGETQEDESVRHSVRTKAQATDVPSEAPQTEQAPYDPFRSKAAKVMEKKNEEFEEAVKAQTTGDTGVVFDENTPKISNIAVFDKVAKALGVSVVFKPIVADAKGRVVNAEYDDKTKTVYIGTQNRERGLQFLLSHELLHRMFDLAPSAYKKFRDAAKAFVGEETFNRRVANTIATYMAQGRNPFFVDIEQEVVADIAGELVGGRYDAFASFIEQNKTDKGFLATLRNILQHVKDFFKGSKAKRIPQNVDNAIKMLNELLAESSKQMKELSKAMEVPQEIVNAVEDIPNVEGAESRASIKIAPMLEAKSHDYLANYYGESKGKVSARFRPVAKGMTAEDLKVGDDAINAMVTIMQPHLDEVVFGKRLLPEEVYGSGYSTIFSNGSYGRSMENTSICTRTLAYNEFTDEIKEQIGRPLTTAESFLASQMLYDIAVDPQCLYCYVSLDRKAYDQELLRYMAQRDAIIEEYRAMEDKSPEAIKALYTKFLNGRKDTEPMRDRFARWIAAVDNNEPLITRQDLTTEDVRNRMKEQGGNIEWQIQDAESYAQNAAQAKKSEDYRAYAGEILRMPFKTVKALSEDYGLRFYSFSEFSPAFIVENMQMIRDAALRGLRGFAYTKELDFVRIFAPSGININVSVFGRKNSEGNVVQDVRQGASWAEAQALREQFPNVGITFVATNDADVEWAMAQEWVDVVIPFHIVRTGADVAKLYGWTDYSSMQADKGAKKADIMPTEHKNNKETFLALCEERGLIPRFSKWVENPNYMKLVNETRRSVDETPILKPIFDLEAAQASWNAFVEKGGYYGGWYEVDAKGYNEAVAQVVSDIEAGKSADEVSYGRQDIPADYAEKARQARVNRTHGNTPRYSLRETNNRFNEQLAMQTDYIDKEKALNYLHHSAPIAEALSNSRLISATNIVKDFENPSIEPENVRYSIKAMDAPYLEAVERGDMETAQRMVMEAAKIAMPNTKVVDEDGNPKVVYHQTNASVYVNRETGQNWDELDWRERMEWDERDDWDDYWEEREFNTFSRVNARTTNEFDGFFFAPEYDEYHEYGDRTIAAFVNIENPASRGDYNIDSSKNNAGREERIRLQNEGYDGVIREYDGVVDEYIAFEPNQIKSADPVTYDDAGNVIPLSERFNPRKADVRYSLKGGMGIENLHKAAETIRKWMDNNTRGKSFQIELPEAVTRQVRREMGRDFDSHNITANGIAHAYKNHGENGTKLTENSIPIRKEDVELIPYIMTAPSYVRKGSTKNNRDSVRYYKNISNGYVVVIEKELDNSVDDLETINMWAELSDVSNAADATLNRTPETTTISRSDTAKIIKDAENAIEKEQKTRFSVRTMTPQEIEEGVKMANTKQKLPNMEVAYQMPDLTKEDVEDIRRRVFNTLYLESVKGIDEFIAKREFYRERFAVDLAKENLSDDKRKDLEYRNARNEVIIEQAYIEREKAVAREEYKKKGDWKRKYGVPLTTTASLTLDNLRTIFKNTNSDEALDTLFEKVYAVASTLPLTISMNGRMSKRTLGDVDHRGKMRINPRVFYDERVQYKIPQTILHELIHSCTIYATLIYDHRNVLGTTWSKLPKEMQDACAELDMLYDKVRHDADFAGMYGITDKDEFIAELANTKFREKLEAKNLWYRFVNAIKKFFGFDEAGTRKSNALAEAEKILDTMLNNFSMASYDTVRRIAISQEGAPLEEDANVRYSIGRRRQNEMATILESKRPDLSEQERMAVIAELDKLPTNKLTNVAFHYFVKGTIRIPEDMPKVEQAVKVAEVAKVDPMAYDSPMELINAHLDVKIKEKPIDPDTVPTLTNKVEYGNGVTVYNVEESEESRQNMRKIINTHFGEDCSPWCLLQGDGKGNLTAESKRYWKHYNKYPKRVAFYNGRLIAFFASDSEPVWWDRQDQSHEGIPMTRKMPDGSGRTATYVFNEAEGRFGAPINIHKGKKGDKLYEEWWSHTDELKSRERREGDYSSQEEFLANGTLQYHYRRMEDVDSFITTKHTSWRLTYYHNEYDPLQNLDAHRKDECEWYEDGKVAGIRHLAGSVNRSLNYTRTGKVANIVVYYMQQGERVTIGYDNGLLSRISHADHKPYPAVESYIIFNSSGLPSMYNFNGHKYMLFDGVIRQIYDGDLFYEWDDDGTPNKYENNGPTKEYVHWNEDGTIESTNITDEAKLKELYEQSAKKHTDIMDEVYGTIAEYKKLAEETAVELASREETLKAEAETFAKEADKKLGVSQYDESRFSVRMTPTERLEQELKYTELGKFEKGKRAIVTTFANNMLYVKKMQEALKEAGVVITDSNDYYNNENAASSKAEVAIEEYDRDYVQPMEALLNLLHTQYGMSYEAVTDYLLAKHSIERHDSGLNALNPDADAVWGRKRVEAIVNDFESKVPSDVVDGLWEMMAKINDRNLEILVEAGIKSSKDIDTIKSHNWKYYVPLKEWDLQEENLIDPIEEYDIVANYRNNSVKGKWFERNAKGRTTKPSEPLSQMIAMGYRAIIAGETNKAKQSLYYLLRDAERKLGSSIGQFWEISKRYFAKNADGVWKETDGITLANAGVDLAQVVQEQREINKMERERRAAYIRANQLEAQGRNADALLERQRGDALGVEIKNRKDNMDVRIDKPDMDYIPNEIPTRDIIEKQRKVLVYISGQPVYIKFDNPRYAEAVNGLGRVRLDTSSTLINGAKTLFRKATRFMSQVSTTANPTFALLTNPVRDFGHAVIMHIIDAERGHLKGFVDNYVFHFGRTSSTIHRALRGKAQPLTQDEMKGKNILNSEERNELIGMYGQQRVDDTLFEWFRKEGGQTGFAFLQDTKTIRDRVQRDVKHIQNPKALKKRVANFFKGYDDVVKTAELMSRYTTFLASVDAGESIGQSISNARNITVNFGRRGDATTAMSGLYVFFNAWAQGLSQFVDVAKRNPIRTAAMLTTLAAMGYGMAAVMEYLWPDDEDEIVQTKVPSWLKRDYLTIPTFRKDGRGTVIRIPMPQMFRVPFALGSIIYDMQNGKISGLEAVNEMANAILNDFTYGFSESGSWWRSLKPTITQIGHDISHNTDVWGRPIHRTDIAGKGTPNAELGAKNVANWAYAIASWLNKATGGSKIESGFIDINPSNLQYAVNQVFGGLGSTIRRTREFGESLFGQAEFEAQNIPIFGGILYTVGEESAWDDYERLKHEYGSNLKTKENLLKEDDRVMTQQERVDYAKRHNVWQRYDKVINALTKIRNQYKYNSDEYEFINREINRQRALLVKMMEEVNFDKNLTDETQRIEAKYDPYRTENYIQIRKEYGNKK